MAWNLTYQNGILGERVEVWWEDDHCWYGGTVRAFDVISGSHTVVYDDGDQREELLNSAELVWRYP